MGSDAASLQYNVLASPSDQNFFSEPEEYILDSYVLPLNGDSNDLTLTNSLKTSRTHSRKSRFSKKHNFASKFEDLYKSDTEHYSERYSEPTQLPRNYDVTQPPKNYDVSTSPTQRRSLLTDKPRTSTQESKTFNENVYRQPNPVLVSNTRRKPQETSQQSSSAFKSGSDKLKIAQGRSNSKAHNSKELPGFHHRLGARNDDSANSSSLAYHHLDTKKKADRSSGRNCENKTKAKSGESSIPRNVKISKPGHFVAKIPFLKTVSIIDTLSDLGPDVAQLSEEYFHTKKAPAIQSSTYGDSCHSTSTSAVSTRFVDPSQTRTSQSIYAESTVPESTSHSPNPKSSREGNSKDASTPEEHRNRRQNHNPGKVATLRNTPNHGAEDVSERKINRTIREKGRTPDWIKKIFKISQKGDLQSLKHAVSGMEETLVRNLSDHSGNNLLHVMSIFGHLPPLVWLLTTYTLLMDALQDENKRGLTPVVCSIKYGRRHILEWLVKNTIVKGKVKSRQGERSLLHIASKYSQIEMVSWLVKYMTNHDITLDITDHHGNTSLHLAARSGNSRLCSILLQHGADVTVKNDIGQKAWEICMSRGHMACAEYLCVHECGLALASDLSKAEAELETTVADNQDLRMNFKEVMIIARRLIREREEVMKELSKVQDVMNKTYEDAYELGGDAVHFDSEVEERLTENGTNRLLLKNLASQVINLHNKWQSMQKAWFGSSLVNTKHKMLIVEESWKKLRQQTHRAVATTDHPLDVFRGKLSAIRLQGGEVTVGDFASFGSSEESSTSLSPFSDDEEPVNGASRSRCEPVFSTPDCNYNLKPNAGNLLSSDYVDGISNVRLSNLNLPSITPIKNPFGSRCRSGTNSHSSTSDNRYYQFNKSAESTNFVHSDNDDVYNNSSALENVGAARNDFNTRLRELALTSDSGSCSVLEVIEPSSNDSESEDYGERYFPKRTVDYMENGPQSLPIEALIPLDAENIAEYQSSDQRKSTLSKGKHFLAGEASADTAAADVSGNKQRMFLNKECEERNIEYPGGSTLEMFNAEQTKRRGFFQKLIKSNGWASRRKLKSLMKPNMYTPDFQESSSGLDNIDSNSHFENLSNEIYSTNSLSSHGDIIVPTTEKTPTNCTNIEAMLLPTDSLHSNGSMAIVDYKQGTQSTKAQEHESSSEELSPHILPLPPLDSSCLLSPPPLPSPRTTVVASISSESQPINKTCDFNENQIILANDTRCVSFTEHNEVLIRPSSSASKADTISRPGSSTSSFPGFKNNYQLRKSNLSLTQDMLPTSESSLTGRLSPAPSEVSKTESALSPPSHLSDVSKSESSRQHNLAGNPESKEENSSVNQFSIPEPEVKEDLTVKSASIIEISTTNNLSVSETSPKVSKEEKSNKKQRPWYEISDEECDILLPDRLPSSIRTRTSSSEDETELC